MIILVNFLCMFKHFKHILYSSRVFDLQISKSDLKDLFYQRTNLSMYLWQEVKHTCESLDAWAFKKACRTVLIIPVSLCCQVPAVVDVIILLLDLQAVKVRRRYGAHCVPAGGKHIQPATDSDTQKHPKSVYRNEGEDIARYQSFTRLTLKIPVSECLRDSVQELTAISISSAPRWCTVTYITHTFLKASQQHSTFMSSNDSHMQIEAWAVQLSECVMR